MDEGTNRTLTQTGAGTPMGGLLRRYWHPVAAVAELDDHPVKAVRLLGEDLALYRDRAGTYGLIDRHCAHRRADLTCGIVEGEGLRCGYHGWRYDHTGRCVEQPYEDTAEPGSRSKERILLKAYKVEALAGLTQGLLGLAPKLAGSRLVDGRFMGVQQSIAVPKGKDAGLLFLRGVVEEAKRSGLVARAIERTGAKGVSVAPLAR